MNHAHRALRCLLPAPRQGVRDLALSVERAVALCEGDRISPDDLPDTTKPRKATFLEEAAQRAMTIDELDRAYAQLVLRTTGGNKQRAASLLGVDRRTLQRWFGEGAGGGEEN